MSSARQVQARHRTADQSPRQHALLPALGVHDRRFSSSTAGRTDSPSPSSFVSDVSFSDDSGSLSPRARANSSRHSFRGSPDSDVQPGAAPAPAVRPGTTAGVGPRRGNRAFQSRPTPGFRSLLKRHDTAPALLLSGGRSRGSPQPDGMPPHRRHGWVGGGGSTIDSVGAGAWAPNLTSHDEDGAVTKPRSVRTAHTQTSPRLASGGTLGRAVGRRQRGHGRGKSTKPPAVDAKTAVRPQTTPEARGRPRKKVQRPRFVVRLLVSAPVRWHPAGMH